TGNPQAIACIIPCGTPSLPKEGKANKSIAFKQSGTSLRLPKKKTLSSNPASLTIGCKFLRCGPSPTRSSCQSGNCRCNVFHASIRYLCPFHTRIVATIPNVGLLGTPIFSRACCLFCGENFSKSIPVGTEVI